MHHSIDKEQVPFWPSGEEVIDNFLDQFVDFGPGEPTAITLTGGVAEDMPSPSTLLDSLDSGITDLSSSMSTANGHQNMLAEDHEQFKAALPPGTQLVTASRQQRTKRSVTPSCGDCTMGELGSISDPKLLIFGDIAMCSPHDRVSAPVSPPLISSCSLDLRKSNRLVDSGYGTSRRANYLTKPQRPTWSTTDAMEVFSSEVSSGGDFQPSLSVDGFSLNPSSVVDSSEALLSPPLTGSVPPYIPDHCHSNFVKGELEDPFTAGVPLQSITPSQVNGLDTPMDTPDINSTMFYQNALHAIEPDSVVTSAIPITQQESSSLDWPLDGFLDNNQLWPAANYINESTSMDNLNWWDASATLALESSEWSSQPGTNNDNSSSCASFDFGLHSSQVQSSLLYTAPPGSSSSATSDLSGRMIDMPQPSSLPAPLLHTTPTSEIYEPSSNFGFSSQQPPTPSRAGNSCRSPGSSMRHRHSNGAPRPRAPSYGIRRRGGPSSPRKASTMLPHTYSSHPRRRGDSASPTPTPIPVPRRSSPGSVRKRRSPRTSNPSTPLSAVPSPSYDNNSAGMVEQEEIGDFCGSSGGDSSGSRHGAVGFVNFTPSDKELLMTGVAPSGSSKTKARREREAMERRRRLGEAALKAVRAAGGDIGKLVEEGFVL